MIKAKGWNRQKGQNIIKAVPGRIKEEVKTYSFSGVENGCHLSMHNPPRCDQ